MKIPVSSAGVLFSLEVSALIHTFGLLLSTCTFNLLFQNVINFCSVLPGYCKLCHHNLFRKYKLPVDINCNFPLTWSQKPNCISSALPCFAWFYKVNGCWTFITCGFFFLSCSSTPAISFKTLSWRNLYLPCARPNWQVLKLCLRSLLLYTYSELFRVLH